jgi:multidrug resistance efflux pump
MNLVERLRGLGNRTVGILREPLIEAADQIEQLEAENRLLMLNLAQAGEQLTEAKKDAERINWLQSKLTCFQRRDFGRVLMFKIETDQFLSSTFQHDVRVEIDAALTKKDKT